MTATLRETKAKLSKMVKLASQGEEVVITVHGKQMAKLVGLPKRAKNLDKKKRIARLATLRRKYRRRRRTMPSQANHEQDRGGRLCVVVVRATSGAVKAHGPEPVPIGF